MMLRSSEMDFPFKLFFKKVSCDGGGGGDEGADGRCCWI